MKLWVPCTTLNLRTIYLSLSVSTSHYSRRISVLVFSILTQLVAGYGSAAKSRQFPFVVFLLADFGGETKNAVPCMGSIVSQRWILTSAQCVLPQHSKQLISVSFAVGYVDVKIDNTEMESVKSDNVIIHPTFRMKPTPDGRKEPFNDFALIRTNRKIKFNNDIKRACFKRFSRTEECMTSVWYEKMTGKYEYKLMYVDLKKREKSAPTKIVFLIAKPFLTDISRGGPTVVGGKQVGTFSFKAGSRLGFMKPWEQQFWIQNVTGLVLNTQTGQYTGQEADHDQEDMANTIFLASFLSASYVIFVLIYF